jgi:hypothetical protein
MAQLQDLFQTHAVVKILDFLTLYEPFEYTRTDIAKETGISRRTLYQVWPILEQFGLVKVTKSSGMIKFYKLNIENPISQHLVSLADKISFFKAERIARPESQLIQQMKLPTDIPSSQVESTVKMTTNVMMIQTVVEGTPSQINKMIQGNVDLRSGETVIPITDSTESEPLKMQKQKQVIAVSHLHQNENPMSVVIKK